MGKDALEDLEKEGETKTWSRNRSKSLQLDFRGYEEEAELDKGNIKFICTKNWK
jgi:hypothetical protein